MIVAVWSQANDISENQVGCSKKKKNILNSFT